MKRSGLLAVLLLLSATIGVASADYVIIIANLGFTKDASGTPPTGDPGQIGPSTGEGGPAGGRGGPGGGLQPGGPGSPGGPGAPGGPNFPGGLGSEDDIEESPQYVMAVIETISALNPILANPQHLKNLSEPQAQHNYFAFTHKGGTTYLNTAMFSTQNKSMRVFVVPSKGGGLVPSIAKQWEAEEKKVLGNAKPTPDGLLLLAEWALKHGQLIKFVETMDKLAKLAPENPKVKAFQQVQAAMARPLTKSDGSENWVGKDKLLPNFKPIQKEKGRYTLLHNNDDKGSTTENRLLDRLEDSYRAFYYWFAFKEVVLPVPEHRLLAVTVPEDQFERHHKIFDSMPLVADGFFARRDNLAILSAASLDHGYNDLRENSRGILDKVNRDSLIKLNFGNETHIALMLQRSGMPVDGEQAIKLHEASVKALMLRALDEESAKATASHEGTRQLLAATGLLPRTVAAPEWIQFGMASFFETPKGAPWGTVGAPNPTLREAYNYLAQYKQAARDSKGKSTYNEDKLKDNLIAVVTDRYFRQAEGDKNKVALHKARMLSWALTYYLAHHKMPELAHYYKELAKLPRDLEFDDKVLFGCFARAFGLLDISSGQVSEKKLRDLATAWHNSIMQNTVENEELLKELHKLLYEKPERKVIAGTPGAGRPAGGFNPPGKGNAPGSSGN